MERRPRSVNFTSSETSSPISKSGSIFRASLKEISSFGSSTSPSATTTRFLQISKSPLSGFTIISKLSSLPYFFFSAFLKTSSSIAISVTLSICLSSLNSEKESISAKFSISILLKCYHHFCFHNIFIRQCCLFLNGNFPLSYWFRLSHRPLQGTTFFVRSDRSEEHTSELQ